MNGGRYLSYFPIYIGKTKVLDTIEFCMTHYREKIFFI